MTEPPVWGGPPGPGPDAPEPDRSGTEPADGTRPATGRHAAHRAPKRSIGERVERRYVLLAAAVVALLVIGTLAVGALSGGDDDPDAAGTVSRSSTPTASESVVSDPTTRATTTTPSPTSSPDEPDDEPSEEPDDKKSDGADEKKAAAKAPVLVLNNSRVTGLAARYAVTIEGEGWSVTRTDNWTRTDLPRTTIFYASGDKAAAQAFAKEFDVVADVEPALSGMGPDLTLVLTSDAA